MTGVDLVLTQPFLLSHVKHVVLVLSSIFQAFISLMRFVSKQGQPQPHIHSKSLSVHNKCAG